MTSHKVLFGTVLGTTSWFSCHFVTSESCDGDDEEMKKVSALVPRPAAVTTAVNVTKSALPDEPVKPAKPAKQVFFYCWFCYYFSVS